MNFIKKIKTECPCVLILKLKKSKQRIKTHLLNNDVNPTNDH